MMVVDADTAVQEILLGSVKCMSSTSQVKHACMGRLSLPARLCDICSTPLILSRVTITRYLCHVQKVS